jgi:predicted hotdog family 3-hydroxylacyl-ACP dehydratase
MQSGGTIALVGGERILDYIPQRPPVVMVDSLYGVEGDTSSTGFTVPGEGVFCTGGVLDECALIENMAQSAALRVGWLCAAEGRPVPLGFIGSVGKCEISRPARSGETLTTTLRVVAEIGGVTMAEATVKVADEQIARCTLKIFLRQ